MAKRTGLPKLMQLSRDMCRIITAFAPIIRKAYPDNTVLQAALILAEEACHALSIAIDDVLNPVP